MPKTADQWWDVSWNPITGCSPISEGCAHCYARGIATRFAGSAGYPKGDPFRVTFHPERLDAPLHWRKPRRIFVCSMGDLFHEDVLANWMHKVFRTMNQCPSHTFIVLTKRPERMKLFCDRIEVDAHSLLWYNLDSPAYHPTPLPNVILGVTVENDKHLDRIITLLQTPAAKRFVSIEPMLGPVDFTQIPYGPERDHDEAKPEDRIAALDWVICGAETGPGARHMNPEWARSVRDQCREAGVPFWMKKMSAKNRSKKGEPPEDLLIREYPK